MRTMLFFALLGLAFFIGMGWAGSWRATNTILLLALGLLGLETYALRHKIQSLEALLRRKEEEREAAAATAASKPLLRPQADAPQTQTKREVADQAILAQPGEHSKDRRREAITAASINAPVQPRRPGGQQANARDASTPLSGPSTLASNEQRWLTSASAALKRWLGANPVLATGLVVIFFGVAFLLKYVAQHNLISLELRLALVALAAIIMLALGWRMRSRHLLYGLGLQGGGVGILYLVVFAAAKLYHLLPYPLALGIMIALVALSCALAVLQNARGLAVFGSIGGFLAPILLSSGAGSHVALFSYYALLNAGILGIAWFKAWRELNLLGFVCTFVLAAAWGLSAYVPKHFASTEPFLILFFLMYAAISILYAHRQPLELRGFIDGPLVFGLPVAAAGLQAGLVRDIRYGLAFSALAFAAFYIGGARLLWKHLGEGLRMLTEAFLALGVVFASLAIPLGLDARWSTAAWALEGAAMMWVGIRQQRPAARLFGLLLQLGAALLFFKAAMLSSSNSVLFANSRFLGCAFIAFAALFSSWQMDEQLTEPKPWEENIALPLLLWGLAWWFIGGGLELEAHVAKRHLAPAMLLFTCASVFIAAVLRYRLPWPRLSLVAFILLPLMLLTLPTQLLFFGYYGHPFGGWGLLAWPLAFAIHYGLLARFETQLNHYSLMFFYHAASFWLLLLTLSLELAWWVERLPGFSHAWTLSAWVIAPLVLISAIEVWGHKLAWPLEQHPHIYGGWAVRFPLALLVLWCVLSFSSSAAPWPLPYIPIFNPLELAELATIALLARHALRMAEQKEALGRSAMLLAAALLFMAANVFIARLAHVFVGAPYRFDSLFGSAVFQTSIAVLWAILALAMTVWGARRGLRRLWLGGALLLAALVLKLFIIDLSGSGALARIVSFLVVGLFMLLIAFFAPIPPPSEEQAP